MAKSIGELLVHEGLISVEQLNEAIALQRRSGGSLTNAVTSLGYLTEEQLNQFLYPAPPVPLKITDTGLSEVYLVDLLLKAAYLEAGTFTLPRMSHVLSLPFSVVEELIEQIRADHLAAIRTSSDYTSTTQVLELTQRGRERAEAAFNISLYVGAAPVPLEDYSFMLARQSVRQVELDKEWIDSSLRHLVIGEELLNQLGPAFSSGRSIFLYGPPGTGKTSIAEALGHGIPGEIYLPQAIEVGGQVIRFFDPAIHTPVEDKKTLESSSLDLKMSLTYDPRWKKCYRPVVMVGGELTLDMLELRYDYSSKFYEAPIHMKAGNGVFILDDFGRQRIEPRQLLNRWIIPLERGIDFPSLHTGMKFEIPFDQITVFSTNLNPLDLVDDAFLRRIRHKIHVQYQSEGEFKEILRRVCHKQGVHYDSEVAEYLLNNHYRKQNRPLVGSHPRDLMEHIVDHAHFLKRPPEFTKEAIDSAAANYFVEL
ncbi:ATPase [Nitrosomonas sp. Nm132]|uniref:ATPase n=1 Tax=Nitrosomonas sp. Nm132 TaxID=1881053 RepID=UPI000881AF4E|nr:ATPase [Nitrosomonas sp. Nm132]SDI01923.1 hypothetical protein SAMN05428952_10606 [Nitrosomonas sp. Nm132]